MIARRRSKTVAFVAILALTTFGALATASAQPADIIAVNKAFQDHYARGNYPAAQIDAQELERLVKARTPSRPASCGSSAISPALPNRKPSHVVSANSGTSTGWSTPSHHSAVVSYRLRRLRSRGWLG
jgi:hypothetical protein